MTEKVQSTEENIMRVIFQRFNQVKSSYQMYSNNPYKPEYVHRLRVDARKLRALLNFVKPLLNIGIYDAFNQALREIGQKLSDLRDLDTLIEKLTDLAIEQPDLVENYAHIFRYLEKERLKLVKSQSTTKAFQEFEGILEGAEAILNELTFEYNEDKESLETFFDKRYNHKINKLKKHVKKLDSTDYQAVHEARKEAKKVRYASTFFKKIHPKKERKRIKKEAKKIQEYLGELTDAHVSIEILKQYQEKSPNKKLAGSFQKIIEHYKKL